MRAPVFFFFFFFFATLDEIYLVINLSLTDVLCRNIYIVHMIIIIRMKYNYLLSFDICLIFYIENGISKIARNSRYINFYLIRRGRNKRAGGKNALRFRNICSENAYGNGNPNIYPKTLLHLLRFFEEKSMTHVHVTHIERVKIERHLSDTLKYVFHILSSSSFLSFFFFYSKFSDDTFHIIIKEISPP